MKTIVLGDIHARTTWKTILRDNEWDKVVFIGDYFDTFERKTPLEELNNFKEIIQFRDNNPDKVIILMGNHDYHYLSMVHAEYSGFTQRKYLVFKDYVTKCYKNGYFQAVYSEGDFLMSHAGISQTWVKNYSIKEDQLVDDVNNLLNHDLQPFDFQYVPYMSSPYGDNNYQGPLWIRPRSLFEDQIKRWIQVVGHTEKPHIKKIGNDLILIDCRLEQFLEIENGKTFKVKVT